MHLGPPETAESARTIALPPFLVELLRAHLTTHDHRHVFVTPERQLYRRSNFSCRAMRPAADGNHTRPRAEQHVHSVKPGLTFHCLRHSHKTWMIADGVPEIAQAHRLGNILRVKIQQTYSHAAPEVDRWLLDALSDRWEKAVADLGTQCAVADRRVGDAGEKPAQGPGNRRTRAPACQRAPTHEER